MHKKKIIGPKPIGEAGVGEGESEADREGVQL